MIATRALVVGAGPAGLAVGACLRRAGVPFEVVERDDRVASAWHRHYERLHLHTPKAHSALPYLPFPGHYPRYPERLELIEYFEAYARHFEIRPHLGEAARRVRWDGTAWVTETGRATYRSDALVVATGLNHRPHLPDWPGRGEFTGRVTHSSAYRNATAYAGQDVLVVGFGNSGGEIALDLAEQGVRTTMAVRGPVNIMPRDVLGLPLASVTIRLRWLPARALDRVGRLIQRLRVGDLGRHGLQLREYGPATQVARDARIPLVDIGTVGLIKRGAIRVKPGISRFTYDGVTFTDGSSARYDTVILATGYRPDLGFLEPGTVPEDTRQLPSGGAAASSRGLYFSGFHVTGTGSLREIGIEARAIARHVAS